MGRLISERMSYRNHYMCSGEATSSNNVACNKWPIPPPPPSNSKKSTICVIFIILTFRYQNRHVPEGLDGHPIDGMGMWVLSVLRCFLRDSPFGLMAARA